MLILLLLMIFRELGVIGVRLWASNELHVSYYDDITGKFYEFIMGLDGYVIK